MTGPVDQGQTYRYRHTITDSNGNLANAGTVTITITLPDGTTANPGVVNSSTGIYDIAYTTSQVGLHNMRGTATGGILGSEMGAWEDAFTVEEPKRLFIGVDEASAHLRAAGIITSTADREMLRSLCISSSVAVEDDLGRSIARRSVTETRDGGPGSIILWRGPILSVTTVTESGTSLTEGTGFIIDKSAGILYRGSTSSEQNFTWGRQNIVITYVVGMVPPPWPAREVAKYLIQSLWQSSQQASHPLLDESQFSAGETLPGVLAGLPRPLWNAYDKLRRTGHA